MPSAAWAAKTCGVVQQTIGFHSIIAVPRALPAAA
jgi:hypothetical protein